MSIEVIKCDLNSDDFIVWKFPSIDLKLGAQLIVNESQFAILVKNGQVYDVFDAGRHTLSTANIPLLNKIINLPFGGNSPFAAEVWFFSKLVKRNIKWGTPTPIALFEPTIRVPVSVRSFGEWGYKVINPRMLYTSFVGQKADFSSGDLDSQLGALIIQKLSELISMYMQQNNLSVFMITSHLSAISQSVLDSIQNEFNKYGVMVENFNIMSINIPQDETKRIQDLTFSRAEQVQNVDLKVYEANQLSNNVQLSDSYREIRSFDVMQSAAEKGQAGGMMSTGLGLGMGMGAFGMGSQLGQNLSSKPVADNKPSVEERLAQLKNLHSQSLISDEDFNNAKQKLIAELLS